MPQTIVTCFPVSEALVQKMRLELEGRFELIASDQDRIAEDLFKADVFFGHAKVPVDWRAVVSAGKLVWIQSSAAGLDHCLTPEVIASDILVSGCSGIVATDFYPKAGQALVTEGIVEAVHAADDLDSLLPAADVVVVTLPLSEMNEQLLASKEFSAMKEGAYLINVGRGSVVDTQAMIDCLNQGRLAGVGFDVVDPEPLPVDSELWNMENVMISPHVGAQSPLRVPTTVDLFLENVVKFEQKSSLLNQVDKELGFPHPDHRIKLI